MNERTYKHTAHAPSAKTSISAKLLQLLVKQTAAAIVLTLVVWTMHNINIPVLNNWANAFDTAISHETDLSAVSEFLSRIIPQPAQDNDPLPLPESDSGALTLH